jgi:hypothetical protein
MLGSKRLAHPVFFSQPFAEVNHLAARGAKGTLRVGEKIDGFFANRALDLVWGAHGFGGGARRTDRAKWESARSWEASADS